MEKNLPHTLRNTNVSEDHFRSLVEIYYKTSYDPDRPHAFCGLTLPNCYRWVSILIHGQTLGGQLYAYYCFTPCGSEQISLKIAYTFKQT